MSGQGSLRPHVHGLLAIIASCLMSAASAWANDDSSPSRPMNDALSAFAERTGVSILFSPQDLAHLTANPIPDGLAPEAALRAILEGTGAEYSRTESGVFVVSLTTSDPRPPATPVVRPVQDGPVQPRDEVDVMVVTARRRVEDLQNTPVAVTAFSQSEIDRLTALEISDFIQYSPGVSVSSDTVFQQLAIRGIGTSLGGNANSYYLDNVPFSGVSVPWNPNVQPFDLERVEVLRGPQGTLFGEGSLGGTVRIITRAPDPETYEGLGEVWTQATQGGSVSHGVRAMANIPLVDNVAALRLVAMDDHRAGWIDADEANNVNDVDSVTYRARLRVTPIEALTVDVAIWSNDRTNAASASADEDGRTRTNVPAEQSYDQVSAGVALEVEGHEISYNFGHNDFAYDRISFLSDQLYDIDIGLEVETHELLVTRQAPSRLSWTGGYYYRRAVRDEHVQALALGLDTDDHLIRHEHALFADFDYQLTRTFSLAAGLRYFTSSYVYEGEDSVQGLSGQNRIEDRNSLVLPRFILSYEPRDNALFYASIARGGRGGQSQPLSSLLVAQSLGLDLPETLEPDSLWSGELGAKLSLFSGRTQLQGAVYASQWTDPASRFELTDTLSGLASADSIVSRGVEVSLGQSLSQTVTANLGVSYINAEYESDVPGSPIVAGSAPEMVPEWTASASLDYIRPISSDHAISARLDMNFTSSRTNPAYTIYAPSDEILLVNGRFGIESDRFALTVFARNLGNEDGALYTVAAVTGEASRPRPRSIGIELQGRF
ncbi:TonB-dependent receptor domain-containing protein [Oceanicaulis sp. LC35]|uniref:TonB-dependent receptor domain-containing protein n=1 Tax=Oceanicaulis sp. LC35 TaxID=3349635 RepID=UPI003F8436ED